MTDTEAILYLENFISTHRDESSLCITESLVLSELYTENKDHESALSVLFNTLQFESQNTRKIELAEIYYQIAIIYSACSKYDFAYTYVIKSIDNYHLEPIDVEFYFKLLYYKTNILTWLGKYDDAHTQLQNMLQDERLPADQKKLLYGLLGIILKGQEKFEESLENLKKSEIFLENSIDKKSLHSIYKSIGDCLIELSRLDEAEYYLLKSYNYFKDEKYTSKNPQIVLTILDFLIKLYCKKNDFKEERKYLYYKNDFQAKLLKTDSAVINQFHWKLAIQNERSENELLKQKNLFKEQFLNLVSHDMKTPLGGILGMIEILQKSTLSVDQKDCLKYMRRSSEDLLKFVNDLLDISKINAGKLEIIPKPIILKDLISDLSLTMNSLVTKTQNTWEVISNLTADSCYNIDRLRLYQIILNLCSNANKFTKNGDIKLHIAEVLKDQGSFALEFRVSDTGTGISPKDQHKIFETFTQLDNDVNHLEKGSGLGLSIVSKLLALMQGNIQVSSELGKGSIFTFEIPVEKIIPKTSSPVLHPSTPFQIQNKKILLIEDNQTIQYFINKIVSQLNMQIETIDSLNAFKELYYQNKFDFEYVLLDNHLTDCQSMDILEFIAEHQPSLLYSSKIISISSDIDTTLKEILKKYNVKKFIQKPFNSEKLIQAMTE